MNRRRRYEIAAAPLVLALFPLPLETVTDAPELVRGIDSDEDHVLVMPNPRHRVGGARGNHVGVARSDVVSESVCLRSIDAALAQEGFASAWRDDGAFRDLLVSIEVEAKAATRGRLWSGA